MTQLQPRNQGSEQDTILHINNVQATDVTFPDVSGHNLLRKRIDLPEQFADHLNIVFIAFQRWQQNEIDSWMPFITKLTASQAGLVAYEFPVLPEMGWLYRTFLNEGMRAGIPDHTTRAHTITLYTDKTAFRRQLQLPTETTMYLLLIDHQGRVLWRTEGPYTQNKANQLTYEIETRSTIA